MIAPFYDTCGFLPLVCMLICSLQFNRSTLYILPEFTPNSLMLDKHADKGEAPWEIFAWCVRDLLSK